VHNITVFFDKMANSSAADDGAELREMVTQTLEARGVLNMVFQAQKAVHNRQDGELLRGRRRCAKTLYSLLS
jgi:hypothetical protein